MVPGWALVAMMSAQAPVDATAPVGPTAPAERMPVVVQPAAPVPAAPPVVAVPVAQPVHWVGPPQPVGPPDLEALDKQFGAYYPEPRGKGLRIGGAAIVAFGAFQLFTALICLATAAGVHDSGEPDSARTLGSIGAGFGISGLLHTAGGVPMLVVGKMRQRRYHAWLLRQPRPGLSLRPGAPGAGPLGLSLALRF